jgi:hypothetical protein
MDGQNFESLQKHNIYLIHKTSRPALESTHPAINGCQRSFSGVKRPKRDVDHYHLTPRLRMAAATQIILLHAFMALTKKIILFIL